eukprot:scaffold23.g4148.t1
MAAALPKAVLLDVNGTLFSTAAAAPAFRALGLQEESVELWLASVLRDGFAAQAAGAFVPFRRFAEAHLARLLSEAGLRADAWREAEAYPDVAPGLRRLQAAGLQVAALTNGSAEGVAAPVLRRAGLEGVVAPLLDIGQARAWKPVPESYRYAVEWLGMEAGQAGLQVAYVQRSAHEPFPAFLPRRPQLVVRNFVELADRLLGGSAG